jgi:hypothetical protein
MFAFLTTTNDFQPQGKSLLQALVDEAANPSAINTATAGIRGLIHYEENCLI